MNNQKHIGLLLFKYMQGTITVEELRRLEQWKLESPENQKFFDSVSATAQPQIQADQEIGPAKIEDRIFQKIAAGIPELQGRRIGSRRNTWKYVAAAAAVVVLAINIAVFTSRKEEQPASVAKTTITPQQNDVDAPEAVYASITLANGEKLAVNGSANGKLVSQGKIDVIKTNDGLIVYKAGTVGVSGETQYNTLTNPKGSNVIGIVLQDGSKVWLNAESSLTYPVAFTGKDRKVTIEGEAYFEVAKNRRKPFMVLHNGMEVRVLGTLFNVSAYAGEPIAHVTLLEGSVKVSSGKTSGILKPGQRARINNNRVEVESNINADRSVAWKNGYFSFDKADVTEVMNQISRWYNVQIKYEGPIPDEEFGGELRRDSKLSSVLKILNMSGVKFRVEGNTVTVFK